MGNAGLALLNLPNLLISRAPFLTLFCAAFLAAPSPAREAAATEWVIDNLHIGTGTYVYYLSENAVRIDNTGNGGIVVAKAPEWRVSCFRPKDKLEFTSALKDFDASTIFAFVPKRNRKAMIYDCKDTTIETVKGLKCIRYNFPDHKKMWAVADLKSAPQVSETVSRYFSNMDVGTVPIRIMNPAPEAPHAVSRYDVAETPAAQAKLAARLKAKKDDRAVKSAVPWLNFNNLKFDHSERLVTDLVSWKKVPFKESDFDYPKGYKQTRDIKDVIISEENRQELMDLVDDLVPAKDKGRDKGKVIK